MKSVVATVTKKYRPNKKIYMLTTFKEQNWHILKYEIIERSSVAQHIFENKHEITISNFR